MPLVDHRSLTNTPRDTFSMSEKMSLSEIVFSKPIRVFNLLLWKRRWWIIAIPWISLCAIVFATTGPSPVSELGARTGFSLFISSAMISVVAMLLCSLHAFRNQRLKWILIFLITLPFSVIPYLYITRNSPAESVTARYL